MKNKIKKKSKIPRKSKNGWKDIFDVKAFRARFGEAEKVGTTLGGEFLCALWWTWGLYIYAFEDMSDSMCYILGIFGWLLGYLIIWSSVKSIEGVISPRVTGGMLVHNLWWGHDLSYKCAQKYNESMSMTFARMVVQFFGNGIGFGMITYHFPLVQQRLIGIIELMPDKQVLWVYIALQILIPSVITAFMIKTARTPEKRHTDAEKGGAFWSIARSGVPLTVFMFPWSNPSFSLGAYIWLMYGYRFPGSGMIAVMLVSAIVQAIGGELIYQTIKGGNARIPQPRTTRN